MCNVSCEKALPLGRAKREARERASENGWGEEPFMVNTISCGTLRWQFLRFAESWGSRVELKIYEWSLQALLSLPAPPPPPSAFASPLARLFFTISRTGELACRLSATCRHIQYSDAIHTTKVTKDFLYLFICYGYVRLDPFPCINSLFWFQSVTVRDVNSLPFSLLIASPGNVVWKE